ncbi:MAG: DUF4340 domain-containing protein [bacterium]|nr:DUF4340 domain-containing protein [bacterium]
MSKKTLTLGLALVALIALAYAYQGPLKKWQNNLGKPKNILAGVNSEKIDKIEISSGKDAITLAKQGEQWKYNDSKDFYADPEIMASALAGLKAAAVADFELVGNNQERKSEFKTDDSGLKIKIYQAGKPAADFIAGSVAGDFDSSYISTAAEAATYFVSAGLASAFSQTEWRDLTVFSADKSKINKIRFQYPNREFSVEMISGQWAGVLPKKFAVNQDKIEKIAESMARLKAARIPEQNFKGTGLEKHLIIVEATGEAVDNILMIGQAKDDLFYAKTGSSDNIYLIDKAVRDELDQARLLYK